MSTEPQTPPAATPLPSLPVLSMNERRVLGVLVEKAKTTPDTYPLSMNSLVTGSNQKSNRDPIMDLTDVEVEEALISAQKKGLTTRITGGRVERWRHNIYEAWRVDKVEIAIMAELLLRGPQTEGELRGRASRMEPIDDLDALRALLKPMAARRLVVYLSPEGRRGTMVTHGFHAPEELAKLRERHKDEPAPAPASPAPPLPTRPPLPDPLPSLEPRLAAAQDEIADLRKLIADLQAQVTDLSTQFRGLKESLGA